MVPASLRRTRTTPGKPASLVKRCKRLPSTATKARPLLIGPGAKLVGGLAVRQPVHRSRPTTIIALNPSMTENHVERTDERWRRATRGRIGERAPPAAIRSTEKLGHIVIALNNNLAATDAQNAHHRRKPRECPAATSCASADRLTQTKYPSHRQNRVCREIARLPECLDGASAGEKTEQTPPKSDEHTSNRAMTPRPSCLPESNPSQTQPAP